jgi:hypothetical protein
MKRPAAKPRASHSATEASEGYEALQRYDGGKRFRRAPLSADPARMTRRPVQLLWQVCDGSDECLAGFGHTVAGPAAGRPAEHGCELAF